VKARRAEAKRKNTHTDGDLDPGEKHKIKVLREETTAWMSGKLESEVKNNHQKTGQEMRRGANPKNP